jgi:hypothetical protein
MPLFLYEKPFYIPSPSVTNKVDYLYDYLDETARADVEELREYLSRFVIRHRLVEVKNTELVMKPIDRTGSWEWFILHQNFRSLTDNVEYGKVMGALQSGNNFPITQILNLHMTLGSVFDTKLLNTIANRTLNAVALMPYEVPTTSEVVSWETIHTQTPFIWLLIQLQIAIHRSANLPV